MSTTTSKANATAPTVLPSGAAQAISSQYYVDVQVEVSKSLFGKSKFTWHQCHIDGQRLQLLQSSTIVATMATPSTSLREHKPAHHTFLLHDASSNAKVVLHFPSASLRLKFEHVLRESKYTPYWVLPASDDFNDLLTAAASIVETEATRKRPSGILSGLPLAHVQAYVRRLQSVHDQFQHATIDQVYAAFLELEAAYVEDSNTVDNLAGLVHRLHPRDFAESKGKRHFLSQPVQFGHIRPLKCYVQTCPQAACGHQWTMAESFQIHIENDTLVCPACHSFVNYDMYKVASLVQDIPRFVCNTKSSNGKAVRVTLECPPVPKDGRMLTFLTQLDQVAKDLNLTNTKVENELNHNIRIKLDRYLDRGIGRHHVDLVRGMWQLWLFIREIAPQFAYWNEPVVLEAALVRYHKFMQLVHDTESKYRLVPTADIALVRQAHQTHDDMYVKYFSNVATDGVFSDLSWTETIEFEPCYAETCFRWAERFDEVYSSYSPSFDAWTKSHKNTSMDATALRKKAWAKHVRRPSRDSHFVGVLHDDVAIATLAIPLNDAKDGEAEPRVQGSALTGFVLGSPVPTEIAPQPSARLHELLDGLKFFPAQDKLELNALDPPELIDCGKVYLS